MMKMKLIAAAAGVTAMFVGIARAEVLTEKVDGYTWTYEIAGGKAVIGNEKECAVNPKPRPNQRFVIPAKLGGKPVSHLRRLAFEGCSAMVAVTIPSTVENIGYHTFFNCTGLRSVQLPASMREISYYAFEGCTALQCVDVGKNVYFIGEYAFKGCSSLRSLVFRGNAPNSVDVNAFSGIASGCTAYAPKKAKGWPEAEAGTWNGLAFVRGDCMVKVNVRLDNASMASYGMVTGGGEYAVGQKVTLKATANKNCVFGGWFDRETETGGNYSPSYSYTVTGADTDFCAVFAPVEEDRDMFSVVMDGMEFSADDDGYVYIEIKCYSWTEPKFAFKGLPAGVKYDATRRALVGKATKPGVYKATLSATNKSVKKAQICNFTLTVPNWKDAEIPVKDAYGPSIPGSYAIWTVDEAAGCSVSGLPPGMKWAAKATVDSKTKIEIPANSIYGAATKPGNFTITFTKTVDKVKHVATSTYKVSDLPVLNIHVMGKGKVSGDGPHLANSNVKLKATPDAGYVFSGWFYTSSATVEGINDGNIYLVSESPSSRPANYTYEMGLYDLTLVAKFITKGEDAKNVVTYCVTEDTVTEMLAGDTTYEVVKCGVYAEFGIWVEAKSETTVKVSGLPAGLKFTAKDIMKKGSKTEVEIPANTIYGVPTKSGEAHVKIQVTTAGKASFPYELDLTIGAINEGWAYGSFEGYGGKSSDKGPVSLTVTKNGKISGKFLVDGRTWTLSAPYFDSFDSDEKKYTATVVCKSGKDEIIQSLTIQEPKNPMGEVVATLTGDAGDMNLYQTFWDNQVWRAAGAAINKKTFPYTPSGWSPGDLVTLTFAANGSVKTAGSFGDYKTFGSAVLVPMEMPADGKDGPFEAWVFVYFPKKFDKFGGYFERVHLKWLGPSGGWWKVLD